MSSRRRPKLLIIGGGIGGLTTAVALAQAGIEANVYEAASELAPVGAGIIIAINGMQVYRRLGLDEAIEAEGKRLEHGTVADRRLRPLSTFHFRDLEQRFEGLGNVAIHRARLQAVLLSAVKGEAVHLGKRCTGVYDDGRSVVARFADGTEAEGDALIGADGLHSAVRRHLFPSVEPRYSGQTSWRGVTPFDLGNDSPLGTSEIWGGDGSRFGFVPLGHGEVYWFAVVDAPRGSHDAAGHAATLKTRFASYPPLVRGLIGATPEANIVQTDISDLPHLPTWHKGRIGLLGDAAHATTPNLGQGGCQAIEDALCLAGSFRKHAEPDAAFADFFAMRREKTRFVVDTSRRLGEVAHWRNPILVGLRNFALRRTPRSVSLRQMEKVLEITF